MITTTSSTSSLTRNDMRVLAIDPGYGRCGVAIIERLNGKEKLLYSNCIETSAKDPFATRLGIVLTECERLLVENSPEHLSLEKLFFNTNQKTAMQVAEIRGAIIGLAVSRDTPVTEFTPGQIKSAVAGNGSADKKQVIKMVQLLLGITKTIRHDDEYDAIAVGLTHFAHFRA